METLTPDQDEQLAVPEKEDLHLQLGEHAQEVHDSLIDNESWFTAHAEHVTEAERDAIENVNTKIAELKNSLIELKRATVQGAADKISEEIPEN